MYKILVAEDDISIADLERDYLEVNGYQVVIKQEGSEVMQELRTNERVWGMNSEGSTATVTVHFNRLREKLEPNASAPEYIETLWGGVQDEK